jgi:hypothetical protein
MCLPGTPRVNEFKSATNESAHASRTKALSAFDNSTIRAHALRVIEQGREMEQRASRSFRTRQPTLAVEQARPLPAFEHEHALTNADQPRGGGHRACIAHGNACRQGARIDAIKYSSHGRSGVARRPQEESFGMRGACDDPVKRHRYPAISISLPYANCSRKRGFYDPRE